MLLTVFVWFCCSSCLAFETLIDLMNLTRQFLLHWVIRVGGNIFVPTHLFFEKSLNFRGFSISSSFGRHLCENCGWAGSEFFFVQAHITEPPCCHLSLGPINWNLSTSQLLAYCWRKLNAFSPSSLYWLQI